MFSTKNQIFISYKSKDHKAARYISEALISIGCNIWHAEYKILEKKKDDQQIESILAEGINSSNFAICLTNESYSKSKWCYDRELIPLYQKLGNSNLFEIKIPNEVINVDGFYNRFGNSYEWNNSYKELFEIFKQKGIIHQLPPNNWDRFYGNNAEFLRNKTSGLLFDISGWKKGEVSQNALKLSEGFDNQRVYTRIIGDFELNIHLLFQTVEFDNDEQSRIRKEDSRDVNEKDIYERNLEETKKYIKLNKERNNLNVKVVGVHPFYMLGYCHYAFTYQLSHFLSSKIMRKYIINLPTKETNKETEIIITANANYQGRRINLSQLLQIMPVFDQFVYSIQYE